MIGNTHQEGDIMVPYDPIKGINYTAADLATIATFSCPTARFAKYVTPKTLFFFLPPSLRLEKILN